jgi:hypothetical protein
MNRQDDHMINTKEASDVRIAGLIAIMVCPSPTFDHE